MAKILKSLQSEGGFSVSEETIIDSTRNILKANSVQVVNNTFADANKIEFIGNNLANDTNATVTLDPSQTINANTIVFSKTSSLITWKGYPVGQYNVNLGDTTASISLENHGFAQGDSITLQFDAAGSVADGTYTVTSVIDDTNFTVNTGIVFDAVSAIVNGSVEITSYGLYWEYSLELSTTCLSDSTNNLSLAGTSRTVLKDNVPPGHTWEIEPIVNNVNKTLSYQITITSNSSIELQGSGAECMGFISNVSAIRD